MSKKKNNHQVITDIIKNVLRYTTDVKLCDRTIDEMALKAIRTTPVIDILSEIRAVRRLPQNVHDDLLLIPCIEMLAIIHNIIDCQLLKNKPDFL